MSYEETPPPAWMRHLRFAHLRTFIRVYEAGNLSRAAAAQGISQPALSKWLQQFEQELGVPLFERHARGLVPTPFGHVFAERARLVVHDLARTDALLGSLAQGMPAPLHVGVTPVAMTDVVPRALIDVRRTLPGARIGVTDGTLDQLLPALLDDRLDLVVSRLEPRDYGGETAQELLYTERLAVVCGPAHPLAGRARLAWPDALRYPWLGPPAASPLSRELEQELALAGQPMPTFSIEASSTVLVASLLERSDMLAVMSERPADYLAAAGRLRRLPLPMRTSSRVGMIWRRDRPAHAAKTAFLQALREAVLA